VFLPYDLTFQLIKRKKTSKDNFGRRKTHEKKHCSN